MKSDWNCIFGNCFEKWDDIGCWSNGDLLMLGHKWSFEVESWIAYAFLQGSILVVDSNVAFINEMNASDQHGNYQNQARHSNDSRYETYFGSFGQKIVFTTHF